MIAFVLMLFAGAKLDPHHLAGVENAASHMIDRLAAVNLFLAVST